MNPILFWIYIATIVATTSIIIIVNVAWADYFPRRWIILLSASFVSLIFGFCALLASELLAPYNVYFYLNPFLYLMYISLLGCSLFAIYLLVFDIHFKHAQVVQVVGWAAFAALLCLVAASAISLQTLDLTGYHWTVYASIALALGLGIGAYTLLAMGSFSDAASSRLEAEARYGLSLIGGFGVGIVIALALIAWSVFFVDLSVALDPAVTAFWLIWVVVVEVLFLLIVRGTVRFIKA